MQSYFGIIDCNNFYVSCERLFNPALKRVPVAVLSNNDGCIVARSQEVKDLGVPKGPPIFKRRSLLAKHNAHIFSSNYTLYGDMSARIMKTIQEHMPYVQIYSIDEAFALFKNMNLEQATEQSHILQKKIYQWTGIPVSIGIAPTKTLAKVANKYAKKYKQLNGVFGIDDAAHTNWLLEHFDVGDVWGIGRRYTKKLNNFGIYNALQLIQKDDVWIRKQLTICGLKTVWELRGFVCYPLESEAEPQKGIACTRSFGTPIDNLKGLKEAVATYVTRAAEKLRKQNSAVISIYVFINTSRFADDYYGNGTSITLPIASAFTPELIKYAHQALCSIYRPGLKYKKAGVIFTQLKDQQQEQVDIFNQQKAETQKSHALTMHTVDSINKKWGRNTLHFAAQGIKPSWPSKQMRKSQRFTTCWQELLCIEI